MNIRYPIRAILLLLFTLLQCVAPLAHAHVNGQNAAQSVHMAIENDHLLIEYNHGINSVVGEVAHAAHEHDSSVVCMQPEYRSGEVALAPAAVLITNQNFVAQPEPIKILCSESTLQLLPLPAFQRPCSQAPPAQI